MAAAAAAAAAAHHTCGGGATPHTGDKAERPGRCFRLEGAHTLGGAVKRGGGAHGGQGGAAGRAVARCVHGPGIGTGRSRMHAAAGGSALSRLLLSE